MAPTSDCKLSALHSPYPPRPPPGLSSVRALCPHFPGNTRVTESAERHAPLLAAHALWNARRRWYCAPEMCSSSGAHVPSSGVRSAMWAARRAASGCPCCTVHAYAPNGFFSAAQVSAATAVPVSAFMAYLRGDIVEGGPAPRRDGVAEPK